MKRAILLLISGFVAFGAYGQIKDPKATEVWEPVPRKITPGATNNAPPSDAIVLFDGTNLNEWASRRDQGAAKWDVADGIMTVKPGTGDIISKRKFGSIQLHLEWRSPQTVVRAAVTLGFSFRNATKCKFSTAMRAAPIRTGRQVPSINNPFHW